ncbi:MAG: hypothetical protein K5921_12665 [Lachnospiraceae bacterium]|nr:hypothetical protein [Lachnospiraceae bacterium]
MSYININYEKKNIEWKFDENSILLHISEYTSPKDIFEAVCYEISRYYKDQTKIKTYKRKIKWTGRFLNAEMCFFSSHSNTAGRYVNFEIVPSAYSNDTDGMENKGLLYLGIKNFNFDVYDIGIQKFGQIIGCLDACMDFFESIDSPEGFIRLMNETEFVFADDRAVNNRRIFLDRISKKD